jgi:hypothetical protein
MFFVNVLEDVRRILRSVRPPSVNKTRMKPNKTETSKSSIKVPSLNSRFATLDLEDLSDEDEPMASQRTPGSTTNSKAPPLVEVVVGPEEERVESYLAVWCFFEDLNELLEIVRQAWKDYRDGTINLVPASLVTNTAVDLARSLEEDLRKVFPRDCDCDELVRLYYEGCCEKAGQDPHRRELPDDHFNFGAFEAAEKSFLSAKIHILENFQGGSDLGKAEHMQFRTPKEPREKFSIDAQLLQQHFNYIKGVTFSCIELAIEDEFSKASRKFVQDGEISMRLLFSATAYLISHHTLNSEVWYPVRDLFENAQRANETLHQHLEFHKDMTLPKGHLEHSAKLQYMLHTELYKWTSQALDARKWVYNVSSIRIIILDFTN